MFLFDQWSQIIVQFDSSPPPHGPIIFNPYLYLKGGGGLTQR